MTMGIYKITNKINGHYYIGQSVDIDKRFRQHCFSARHLDDKDHNSPIHLAIAKYGENNFTLELLEEICDKTELNEREVYWIRLLEATKNGNYNILAGGQDRIKFDDKSVELYDLTGKYVKTIPSATLTAKELGVSRSSIYGVLHKERPTCKGYQMKYAEDKRTVIKPFISKQGGALRVAQINSTTNQIIKIFNSIAEASRETGANSSTITKVCKGKLKTTKNYKWIYYEEE
jgi:group I intron endonuclease